jgi:hypothetical protein
MTDKVTDVVWTAERRAAVQKIMVHRREFLQVRERYTQAVYAAEALGIVEPNALADALDHVLTKGPVGCDAVQLQRLINIGLIELTIRELAGDA